MLNVRCLLASMLLCATACAAQSGAAATDVPPAPGPGPMQAEAELAKATIEAVAHDCSQGHIAQVKERLHQTLKVSRPVAPDLGELELPAHLSKLCAGSGDGSLAEVEAMVEEISIQPEAALATVTLNGRLRGSAPGQGFTVRGLIYLRRDSGSWKIARAAYWPHEIPPVS